MDIDFHPHHLLRRALKFQSFLARPIRKVLRWAKVTDGSTIRITKKPSVVVVTPGQKLPPPPRRKRVRDLSHKAVVKPRPKIKVLARVLKAEPKQSNELQVAERLDPTTHVLKMSVIDLYRATRRTIRNTPADDVSPEDEAFLQKLKKVTFQHDFFLGVKKVEEQIENIDPMVHQRKADAQVAVMKPIWNARITHLFEVNEQAKKSRVQLKAEWAQLVGAALSGHAKKMDVRADWAARWLWYERVWVGINRGGIVPGTLRDEDIPSPVMPPYPFHLDEYEYFILSPLRPNYETKYWYERVEEERKLWSLDNLREKVLPIIFEHQHGSILRDAARILKYLNIIVRRYTSCDFESYPVIPGSGDDVDDDSE